MTFRALADPTARAAAAAAQQAAQAAQQAASDAQTSANSAIAAAGTAQSAANNALTVANGKNKIYLQGTAPTGSIGTDDQWIDTSNGNRLNVWNGSAWVAQQFGTNALAAGSVTAALLAAGAVTAGSVAAGAIDGQTITGATLRTAASGQRVQLDSANGLIGYNASGQAVTQVRTSDGVLIASGATITGELDTGAAGTARARIYQGTDARGNPQGVIALEDGVSGDTPAQLISGSAGGLGGGSTTLSGGKFGGVTAPSLVLQVDQAGNSVANLTAPNGLNINGQPYARQKAWRDERFAHTSNAQDTYTSATGVVTVLDKTITSAPPGDYLVTVNLVAASSAAAVAYLWLHGGAAANPPTDLFDLSQGNNPRCDLVGSCLPYSLSGVYGGWPGGDLRFLVQHALTTTGVTCYLQTSGTAMSIAYLGPRS